MPEGRQLTPTQITILASGAVLFLASFLPWVDVGPFSANAWDDFAFPTYTWAGIFGGALALGVVLSVFSTVSLPRGVLGFSLGDLYFILADFAVLITFSFLIAGDNFGIGFWLSFLASIGLVVGAWRFRAESAGSAPLA